MHFKWRVKLSAAAAVNTRGYCSTTFAERQAGYHSGGADVEHRAVIHLKLQLQALHPP